MEKNGDALAIYSRKSKYTGKGESIGNQVELCREFVRARFGEEALERVSVYEDEGYSGGNVNRPGFREMMADAKKRRLRAIIVYRLDRISRNVSDFAGLIEELTRLDVSFLSIREQFDTGTPMGRAMMYVASVFSQLERETIAERIRDNMHELAKTGRWLGGVTPTGYVSEAVEIVTVDGKRKKTCMLRVMPEEAKLVRQIYELYEETDSLTATEARLIQREVMTKNDRYFTRFSIKGILQNPVYAMADNEVKQYFTKADASIFSGEEAFDGLHGIMAYNRTDQEKGRTTEYLPESEWIIAVGAHQGIIPGRTWVHVQESLRRNKDKAYRKPRQNEALLTGLLFCSCTSPMYPKLGRSKGNGGRRACPYVCKLKERSRRHACASPNVDADCLDQAILAVLGSLTEDRESFFETLGKSRGVIARSDADQEEKRNAMIRKREEAEKKIEGLVDSLSDLKEGLARERVAKRIEELSKQRAELELGLRMDEERCLQGMMGDEELRHLVMRLNSFEECLEEMTVEQKRVCIRMLIERVIWDGEGIQVVLKGACLRENGK